MLISVAPTAGLLDLAAPKPDAGGGGDLFAPLIAGLLTPSPDGKTLPEGGETLPAGKFAPDASPDTKAPIAIPAPRAPGRFVVDTLDQPIIFTPPTDQPLPTPATRSPTVVETTPTAPAPRAGKATLLATTKTPVLAPPEPSIGPLAERVRRTETFAPDIKKHFAQPDDCLAPAIATPIAPEPERALPSPDPISSTDERAADPRSDTISVTAASPEVLQPSIAPTVPPVIATPAEATPAAELKGAVAASSLRQPGHEPGSRSVGKALTGAERNAPMAAPAEPFDPDADAPVLPTRARKGSGAPAQGRGDDVVSEEPTLPAASLPPSATKVSPAQRQEPALRAVPVAPAPQPTVVAQPNEVTQRIDMSDRPAKFAQPVPTAPRQAEAVARPIGSPLAAAPTSNAAPESTASPVVQPATAASAAPLTQSTPVPQIVPTPQPVTVAVADAPVIRTIGVPTHEARTDAPALHKARPAVETPLQPTATVVLPALHAFGAAMRRALADETPLPTADIAPVLGIGAPAPAAPLPAQPTATLDTADRRWPHVMAEQIERLRDLADEGSTRIRLLPDALGPVDVAVRRDGDALHVHFAAREAETRQLLADAQPRLAEAADARGLKLGRTDISGGEANLADRQQQRAPAQQPPLPTRPAPARAHAAAADTDDSRIA